MAQSSKAEVKKFETLSDGFDKVCFGTISTKQLPIRLSPCPDSSNRHFTGQGKKGYYESLTPEEIKALGESRVITPTTTITLNPNDVWDLEDNEIQKANFEWVIRHPYVAIDREELARKPKARFFVMNELRDSEVRLKNSELEDEMRYKIRQESEAMVSKISRVLGNPAYLNHSKDQLVDFIFAKFKDGKESVMNLKLAKRMLDKKNRAEFEARLLFQDLRQYGLIRKAGSLWGYGRSTDEAPTPLGSNIEDAIAFMLNPDNGELINMMRATLVEAGLQNTPG